MCISECWKFYKCVFPQRKRQSKEITNIVDFFRGRKLLSELETLVDKNNSAANGELALYALKPDSIPSILLGSLNPPE